MIIDAILDRREGLPYNEKCARYIYDQATFFEMDSLARAFDMGSNEDCQRELARYIDSNDYNESIKDFVYSYSVKWV